MADSKKKKIFDKFLARMKTIKQDKYASNLFAALSQGKNSYMRIDRLESSAFDLTWIKAIEDCIYDLGDIVANPKQVTKTVSNIVPVELAKKIGAESVMHLASHTQYIKDITEEGDVVPNKILSMSNEDDIHTYENRFIATLIRRLVLFIEKRYEFVKQFSPLHDEEILFFKTKAIVDGSEVEIETKVKVRSESDTKMADISNKYISRILQIREYVMYFYGSKFMKDFKTERDVRNPIVLTNILRKNPKYHKCYQLFRFIEKYDRLGVSYKVDEDASIFNEQELEEMNTLMFANYLAVKARDRSKQIKSRNHVYKPKILTSIDDEKFIYGDLLSGPIEFVRVDEQYQRYLDEKINRKSIPSHPTKIEKEYYKEEIEEKVERKEDKIALDKLAKRKKKELIEHEKQVQKIIAQREKEERERIARELEEARLAEERRIEAIRQQLIKDAQENQEEDKKDYPVEETPVEEVNNENFEEEELDNDEELEEAPVEQQEEPVVEEVVEQEEVQEQPIEETSEEVIEQPVEEQPQEAPIEEAEVVEAPAEEQVVEEQPVEQVEEVIEEQPIEEAVEETPEETIEEEAPAEEPVVEEQSQTESTEEDIEAIRQALIQEALNEEVEQQEIPEEQPVEEQPIEEPQEQQEEVPVEEVEEVVEETPAESLVEEPQIEEAPVEEEQAESIEEQEPVEEIENEEAPVQEEKPEIPAENSEKPIKKPLSERKKSVKKKIKHVKKPKQEVAKIPGKFIVKTAEGYFVNSKKYSVYKHEAKVFDDFNEANRIKATHGGKVVKL